MMDRRELLHRASMLLGGVITASAASGILAGCTTMAEETPEAAESGFLTPEETATVTAISEQILPKTDTPGATDVGVPAFIDRMLAGYYTDKERTLIRAGLAKVSSDSDAFRGKPFAALTSDEQVSLMKTYDQQAYYAAMSETPHFFRLIKELTLLGYCTSKVGATTLMRYEQTPGPFKGDVPVSAIGKAWAT